MSRQPQTAAPGIEQKLFRVEDFATRADISRSFAWKLVATGAIPVVRIGKSVRLHIEDIDAYIARLRQAS